MITLVVTSLFVSAQGQWAWMTGDTANSSAASYGVQGVPSANNWPKAIYSGCEWTDKTGNFWFYGGNNGMSDLFKYDPTAGTWTWVKGPGTTGQAKVYGVKGVPAAANTPASRTQEIPTWTDNSGNLWLYGGDMWRYTIGSNMWTWMAGAQGTTSSATYGSVKTFSATSTPGTRTEATCTWVDGSGFMWLFGGGQSGRKNDLWKYDPSTNQWAWWGGPTGTNNVGNYGVKGVAAASNWPPARYSYLNWYDPNTGKMYLYGGYGHTGKPMADLWMYDAATDMWTWLSGSQTPNDAGQYGVQCVPSTSNYPPSRFENKQAWVDECGNLWHFGGFTYLSGTGQLSDLWRYKPSTNEWTWVNGPQYKNTQVQFGQQGVPSPSNKPPNNYGSAGWQDANGQFWMYGGPGTYNCVIWKYYPDPPTAAFTYAIGASCGEVNFTDNSTINCNYIKQYFWDFGDSDTAIAQNPTHIYNAVGTYNVQLIVRSCTGQEDTTTMSINVTGNAVFDTTIATICQGQSYYAGGANQTTSGLYNDTLKASTGCDSIVTTNLTVTTAILNTVNPSICQGQSYYAEGANQTVAGTYHDTLISAGGCDSILTTNLSVIPLAGSTVNPSICQGQSYLAGGANQTTSGTYYDTLTAASGCDSIITTNLTVTGPIANTVNPSICQGQSYFAGGANQTTSGTYYDTLTSAGGCDSILTTNLTVTTAITNTVNPGICQGQSYFAGGANQTTSGTYYDTLTSAGGCDSIVTTNLTVNPTVASTINPNICQGQSYFAGGANQTTSGTYYDTLSSAAGCDSIVTTNLTVLPSSASSTAVSVCQGQTTIIHGVSQNTAGVYVDTLQNSVGCDSIASVTLTVNPVFVDSVNFTICEGDSVQVNGNYYSSAQSFNMNYASSYGCDSTISYSIKQIAKPIVDLGPDQEGCDGNTVSIAVGELPDNFESTWWNGSHEPVQLVTKSGDYWITVTHPLCYNIKDTVTVEFKDCNFYIYVPNAFTPGGDAINPTFKAKAYGELEEFEMVIFDRWGELMFTTNDIDIGWDGTYQNNPVKQDVYVYRIDYKSKYDIAKSIVGRVTLLR